MAFRFGVGKILTIELSTSFSCYLRTFSLLFHHCRSRKRPAPIEFDPINNPLHRDFITSMVYLRVQSFGWSPLLNIHALSDVQEKWQKYMSTLSLREDDASYLADESSSVSTDNWTDSNSSKMEKETNVSLISLQQLWQHPLEPQTYEKVYFLLKYSIVFLFSSHFSWSLFL